ncbi:MAG TPA: homocysteine S-methyltransferase family protein [Gemmatimonadales bacterium]|nr:homocysteine S-methyltransferase family protein [Gemmatimonadales bacterium]
MSKYRNRLPQLGDTLFLTDGGLETTLVFHEGLALPHFAAFDLLKNAQGVRVLREYFERYARIAREQGAGLVLETPTWRANRDWGARLGYDGAALADANRSAVGLLLEVRSAFERGGTPIVISGNLGPRGDGYVPGALMSAAQARDYHAAQIETFAQTDADMVAAFTMNYPEEAIGVALAARSAGMPVALSFTAETDGRLPSGASLEDAIARTDEATGGYPAYYMINCAHPEHLASVTAQEGGWRDRVRGLRANASRRSHAELDESSSLDEGDPAELGAQYRELRRSFSRLSVVGGCCGTDHRHVEKIGRAMAAGATAPSMA